MKNRVSAADILFYIFNGIFMTVFVIVTVYPVWNTLVLSFNEGSDAALGGIYLWPRVWSTKSIVSVVTKDGIITGTYISILRTVVGTTLSLVLNAILAFIVSRKKFLFRSQLSLFWVITMYVSAGLIPTLLIYKNLGMVNSFKVYVIPGAVSAFNMLVIRTFMQGIPESLEESAQLDGAGYVTIFLKIISPLCKPVYATMVLFAAVAQWNSWFDTMLYNRNNSNLTTLQYELIKYLNSVTSNQGGGQQQGGSLGNINTLTPITVRCAASVLTMLPIVCLYPFLQRYFVTGLTIGGVKE
ncbi:MAG: carbohydrate ABC transporter permease [Lachnospiraceae bacterium]|nr:carbohydrate ABC transporter permease [Lachnospiraceae bacterium]